jgi:CDP-glucose 4,6-dehydratase
MLAEQLSVTGHDFAESWNFGPHDSDTKPVRWIVDRLCSSFPGASWRTDEQPNVHEAMSLRLDSSKANHRLGWHPKWRLDGALQRTIDWHRAWRAGSDMAEESLKQIRAYESAAIQ